VCPVLGPSARGLAPRSCGDRHDHCRINLARHSPKQIALQAPRTWGASSRRGSKIFPRAAGHSSGPSRASLTLAELRKALEVCSLPPLVLVFMHPSQLRVPLRHGGGGSIERLRIIMGHESVTTTERYSHLSPSTAARGSFQPSRWICRRPRGGPPAVHLGADRVSGENRPEDNWDQDVSLRAYPERCSRARENAGVAGSRAHRASRALAVAVTI